MLPSFGSVDKSAGTGDRLDSPKRARMKLEYSCSGIFWSLSIVSSMLQLTHYSSVSYVPDICANLPLPS